MDEVRASKERPRPWMCLRCQADVNNNNNTQSGDVWDKGTSDSPCSRSGHRSSSKRSSLFKMHSILEVLHLVCGGAGLIR